MSASVGRTLYSLVATTCYPSVLEDPASGPLATRKAHRGVFDSVGSPEQDLGLPWQDEHWARFWTNYLPGIRKFKDGINSERAWDFAVPFEVLPPVQLSGPAGTTGRIRRFLYPWAVVAVAEIELQGEIPVEQVAQRVSATRRDRVWQVSGGSGAHHLERLLADLTDDVQARVVGANGDGGEAVTSLLSVAAPVCGNLPEQTAAVPSRPEDVNSPTGKTIAGLSTLSPPGVFVADRLVPANTKWEHQARAYVTKEGHVLWHAERLGAGCVEDERDTIGCLLRNHTAAVAHVAACAFVVKWAADRFRGRRGLSDAQAAIVGPVIDRLRALHKGDAEKTYRSEVVVRRIAPVLDDLTVAARAT